MDEKFVTLNNTVTALVNSILPKLVERVKASEQQALEASIGVAKLEEVRDMIAQYDIRIAKLEATIEAIAASKAETVEKPKRKRRTKAEMEAARSAVNTVEQQKIEEVVPEAMDPTEPEEGVGLVPETVDGVDITKSVVKSVLQDIKSCAGDVEAVAGLNQYGPNVVRYIAGLTPEVIREIVTRFPD